MQLQTSDGQLNLKLLHSTPALSRSQPDLHVEISAKVARYSVQEVKAWLEWPDVEGFMNELEALMRDVKGEAKLYAMSPEDFQLVIANMDSLGHFGVSFAVGSTVFARNGQFRCGLRGGFEAELGQLEEMLHWFKSAVQSAADA
jgi:hypothetical protein